MDKRTQLHIWYAFVAVFVVLVIQNWWQTAQETELIPYSQFLTFVETGKVDDITVSEQFVRGAFKEPQDGKTQFVTARVDPAVAQELAKSGVQFTGVAESSFLRDVMSWAIPILIFFAIWAFVFRRFPKSRAWAA
jgi:cell division protease FtsH